MHLIGVQRDGSKLFIRLLFHLHSINTRQVACSLELHMQIGVILSSPEHSTNVL